MGDLTTLRMIERYRAFAEAPMFLTGHFRSPPLNFHNSETVKLDVQREGEEVAVVVTDMSVGGNLNEASIYTSKEFKPPIYKEKGVLTAWSLMQRQPGQDPFENPNFIANAMTEAGDLLRKMWNKIRRAIEFQSSQVLQTGQLQLPDEAGNLRYVLDFKAKPELHITRSWAASGGVSKLDSLAELAQAIRTRGQVHPNRVIMGHEALSAFIRDPMVLQLLDNARVQLGEIRHERGEESATFHGKIRWKGYEYEIWSYDGTFVHPATKQVTHYVTPNKIIMLSRENTRLDLTFGNIPLIGEMNPVAAAFLPSRVSVSGRGADLIPNAWITENREALVVSGSCRPLTIPTAIDGFGTLTVTGL